MSKLLELEQTLNKFGFALESNKDEDDVKSSIEFKFIDSSYMKDNKKVIFKKFLVDLATELGFDKVNVKVGYMFSYVITFDDLDTKELMLELWGTYGNVKILGKRSKSLLGTVEKLAKNYDSIKKVTVEQSSVNFNSTKSKNESDESDLISEFESVGFDSSKSLITDVESRLKWTNDSINNINKFIEAVKRGEFEIQFREYIIYKAGNAIFVALPLEDEDEYKKFSKLSSEVSKYKMSIIDKVNIDSLKSDVSSAFLKEFKQTYFARVRSET